MSITFSCSSCKAKMTVPDTLAGKRGKCSKCKGPVLVPAANGAVAPAGNGAGAPASAIDLEAEAAALLSDAPKEEKKAEFIEFKCPQCDEPLKMGLDLAGKRAPCPECRRIIPVPIPKDAAKTDWRNAGPKLPAAAKRDDGPAPEGAWGTGAIARASHEALQEAGVIKEKEKPLTFYQRYQRVMLVVGTLAVLAGGGLGAWTWMTHNTEKNAYAAAMATASAKGGALGDGGLAALHGFAGEYQLRRDQPDCAREAKEQYARAAGLGKSTRAAEADALLADLAVAALALAGGPEETDTGRKLPWKETHQLFLATVRGIDSHDGKVAALRRLTAALVERGYTEHVLPAVNGLYGTSGPERPEAVATAGLELHRLGKKEEAAKALAEALGPFLDKKDKKDKKEKPPALTAPVVALAALEGKEPPPPGKSQYEREAQAVGLAEALARQGKLDDARGKVKGLPRQDGGELRGLIAVAAGADPKAAAEEVEKALAALGNVGKRRDLDWPLLRLIEVGVAAGVAPDKLEPAAAAIEDPGLGAWGRLQLLRARLAKSSSAEGADLVEKIDPKTVGGLVARLELARHNTRLNHGWAGAVQSWDEGPKAMGSLGVALGIQGGK